MNNYGFLGLVLFYISCVVAWATAIIHTVKNDMIAMLIVDIFIVPVGIVHGFIIWFT